MALLKEEMEVLQDFSLVLINKSKNFNRRYLLLYDLSLNSLSNDTVVLISDLFAINHLHCRDI